VCVGAWAYVQYLGWPLWGWMIGLVPVAVGLYYASKGRHFGNILILLSVAAYVVSSLFLIYPPGETTRLGLDLRGGVQVVYEARTTDGKAPSAAELDKTLAIIERRVNGLGVSESVVQKQGTDQISVALPGIRDVDQALAIVGKTAQLEFYDDAETRLAGPAETRKQLLEEADGRLPDEDLEALKKGESVSKYRIIEAPPGVWGDNTEPLYFLYLHEPSMTGAAIKEARQGFDQFQRPNVLMEFTDEGGREFEEITRRLAIRGALKQESQTFAIVLDDVMESDPQVDYVDNPQGISGGSAEITGDFTIQEAKDLALVLNTGALPVTLTPVEKQQVSATLGEDSLNAGLLAGAIGLALVLIFLVVIYRFLGLVADLAMIVYAIILWGVFNAIPVTLTLPGIAGMILTIGVAADANVVVFERIKEEVRAGKSVRSAITSGYSRGFRTILDANALILLTALVLFYFATSQPKGFALTLMIGVVVSMFTAVLATRALLGLLSDIPFFNRASFMGMGAKPGELLYAGEFSFDEPPAGAAERRGRARREGRGTGSRERAARRAAGPAGPAAVGDGSGRGRRGVAAAPAVAVEPAPEAAPPEASPAEPAEAPAGGEVADVADATAAEAADGAPEAATAGAGTETAKPADKGGGARSGTAGKRGKRQPARRRKRRR
jgi:preprotein translocase subunit SecD